VKSNPSSPGEARALPGRLASAAAWRHGETVVPEPPTFRVRDLPARGWIPLGERPGTDLVYGAVGQPWKGTGGLGDGIFNAPTPVPAMSAPEDPGELAARSRTRKARAGCGQGGRAL
jgi:hypothetical protein